MLLENSYRRGYRAIADGRFGASGNRDSTLRMVDISFLVGSDHSPACVICLQVSGRAHRETRTMALALGYLLLSTAEGEAEALEESAGETRKR